jgi:transcription antitermination factor NusG
MAMHPWFAIQTRPRHERAVERQLAYKGYEVFLPTYRVRRRWSDRTKEIECPLFDGYVFCRLDLGRLQRIVTTPGVISIVGTAREPVAVEEDEIMAVQRLLLVTRSVEPWPFLHVGQRVRIQSGALCGVEGILQAIRNTRRVVVSISLLQRSVAVELDDHVVTPLEHVYGF